MATTTVANARVALCRCGRYFPRSLERCTTCSRELQRQYSQQSLSLPQAPSRTASSQYTSPTSSRPSTPTGASRPSQTTVALNSAFASDGELTGFFPRSIYRLPETSTPTPRTPPAPALGGPVAYTTATQAHIWQPFDAPGAGTPGESLMSKSGYAPMAAAFVRAARRLHFANSSCDQGNQGRRQSLRPSLELEARMFDGPA